MLIRMMDHLSMQMVSEAYLYVRSHIFREGAMEEELRVEHWLICMIVANTYFDHAIPRLGHAEQMV